MSDELTLARIYSWKSLVCQISSQTTTAKQQYFLYRPDTVTAARYRFH
jgi:hypothetical protein